MNIEDIPIGYCKCGCGTVTKIATSYKKGKYNPGEPLEFVKGHSVRPFDPIPEGHRKCRSCKLVKPFSECVQHKKATDGVQRLCRSCATAQAETNRKNHPGRWQRNHLKKRIEDYGGSIEDYDRLFKEQGGRCAICNTPETRIRKDGTLRYLSVDHCHKSQKVRALLCGCCNVMIGMARDDITLLQKAIAYLRQHQAKGARPP